MTTTYTGGFTDLMGRTLGTLSVGSIAGRQPIKWQVTCTRCGSQWAELHSRLLTNPLCRNDACVLQSERERQQRFAPVARPDAYSFDPNALQIPGRVPW